MVALKIYFNSIEGDSIQPLEGEKYKVMNEAQFVIVNIK